MRLGLGGRVWLGQAAGVNEVTRMLQAAEKGDAQAASALLPLVYEELRRLAGHKMSAESAGHTLQPTALVHEAWLRLVGGNSAAQAWQSRAHFFGAAGEAMRRILVDHARRKKSQKRGGGLPLEELEESHFQLAAPADELLAIHDALDRLALEDPQSADLVKMRYFIGMTMEESANVLGLSQRAAERLWTFARAWLRRELNKS